MLGGAPAKFAMQVDASVCIFCVCHKRDKTVSVTLNPKFTKKKRLITSARADGCLCLAVFVFVCVNNKYPHFVK